MDLDRFPVFAALTDEQRALVADLVQEVEVGIGEELTHEGDLGYHFFAIEEGTAEVLRDGEVIAELGPGDVFGELALLIRGRRSASVTALSPMRLVVLFVRDFHVLERRVPEFGRLLREQSASYLPSAGFSG